jgi:uncharacterized RDD family membrane protein YckC
MKEPVNALIRLAAAATDMLLNLVLVLLGLWYVTNASDIPTLFDSLLLAGIGFLLLPLVLKIIQAYLLGTYRVTIGKALWGLEVTDMRGKGVNMETAFFRTFIGPMISAPALWLGYAWILKDPQQRGWHDLASGTVVVRRHSQNLMLGIFAIAGICTFCWMLLNQSLNSLRSHGYLYRDILMEFQSKIDEEERRNNRLITPTPMVSPSYRPDLPQPREI